jgi:hypothetical protein
MNQYEEIPVNLVAAFHWNSTEKEITCLIINEKTFARTWGPKLFECKSDTFEEFGVKATNAMQEFFAKIDEQRELDNNVQVRFKLVSPAGRVTFYDKYRKPGDETNFVDGYFKANVAGRHLKSNRIRSNLKKPPLDIFKAGLKECALFSKARGDAYKHRIWAVALHATAKTVEEKIFELWHQLRQPAETKKEAKKLYQELLPKLRGQA